MNSAVNTGATGRASAPFGAAVAVQLALVPALAVRVAPEPWQKGLFSPVSVL
ncbi:hypothetical protein [Kitasatospora sp. KL5]|uniref:hypothetical protein n=1 Tax=Kitasatospora sp. KL5 TaxID=3425125 RepID=UPI003D7010D1